MFRYYGVVKKIITDLKFSFAFKLAPTLSEILIYGLVNKYPHILKYWQQNNFSLVPIPLHIYRQNWRGFNQSELICQKLATELNLKVFSDLLIRTHNTIPQTRIKDRRLRRLNTQSSFSLNQSLLNSVKFPNYILVDDVYTTGSTIRSAISAMPANSHIWVLTLAG
jgi:ComF family protein